MGNETVLLREKMASSERRNFNAFEENGKLSAKLQQSEKNLSLCQSTQTNVIKINNSDGGIIKVFSTISGKAIPLPVTIIHGRFT